jgi:hypothetical protein
VNNCGKNYHLEVASREFETEFRRLVSKSQPQIAAVSFNYFFLLKNALINYQILIPETKIMSEEVG